LFQAYNGGGKAASHYVTVKAAGPVAPPRDPEERQYLAYVVGQPALPPTPPQYETAPPEGIYR